MTPSEAKKLGGRISFEENDFQFINDWNNIKLKIMEEISREYYNSNPKMKDKLVGTGTKKLVHSGFGIDTFWGVNKNGGENNHGKILMKLRDEIKNEI
jgi:predicted NAD-dependent protein-ADP-ribosyltransferase YbiA (DUF1768 family)